MADNYKESFETLKQAAESSPQNSFVRQLNKRYRKFYTKYDKIIQKEQKQAQGVTLTSEE